MKTITLTQPWATLVAIGAKHIETRSWRTGYRGLLAIHAAKGFPSWAVNFLEDPVFKSALAAGGYRGATDLPLGAVVAVGRLVECVSTDALMSVQGTAREMKGIRPDCRLSKQEKAFGDFSLGRFAWILEDVQRLEQPIPVKGALSLWEWPSPAEGLVYA